MPKNIEGLLSRLDAVKTENEEKIKNKKEAKEIKLQGMVNEGIEMVIGNERLAKEERDIKSADPESHYYKDARLLEMEEIMAKSKVPTEDIRGKEKLAEELEEKISSLDKLAETENIHSELDEVVNEAKNTLSELRMEIERLKVEGPANEAKRIKKTEKEISEVDSKWSNFGDEMKSASSDPVRFAAKNILDSKRSQNPDFAENVSEKDLAEAINKEKGRRSDEQSEEVEKRIEEVETDVLNKLAEELEVIRTEVVQKLKTVDAELDKSKDEEGSFANIIGKKKKEIDALKKESYWVMKELREEKRWDRIGLLEKNIEDEKDKIMHVFRDVENKTKLVLEKIWYGYMQEEVLVPENLVHPKYMADKIVDRVNVSKKTFTTSGYDGRHGDYFNTDRVGRVSDIRNKLQKRSHEVQDEIYTIKSALGEKLNKICRV